MIDKANRKALVIQVVLALPAALLIHMDNGLEMTNLGFFEWAQRQGIALNCIQQGESNRKA